MNPLSALAGKRPFLLVALAVLALDQWTKWLVERRFAPHSSHEIIPGLFHLSHVRNTGVAFGLLPAQGDLLATAILAALGLSALALVTWLFVRTPRESTRLLTALSLVLGGAVGNLLDRLASGAVTDFLGVYIGSYRWPDFNVADSAICIGLGLLLLDSFASHPEPEASET